MIRGYVRAHRMTPVNLAKGIGDNLAESTDAYTVGQSVPFTVKTSVPNYPLRQQWQYGDRRERHGHHVD